MLGCNLLLVLLMINLAIIFLTNQLINSDVFNFFFPTCAKPQHVKFAAIEHKNEKKVSCLLFLCGTRTEMFN